MPVSSALLLKRQSILLINEKSGFGIENLSWCPEVYFADNVIRNNRARGTLFSTPLKTVVERNLFDHTSGRLFCFVVIAMVGLKRELAGTC